MLRLRRRAILLFLLLVCFPIIGVHANTKAGVPVWFFETGHTLAYAFREFYDRHGGLAMFGYPLTEVFVEGGRPVQYFERARMEWHADLGLVQVGHLGRWVAERQQAVAAAPVAPPAETRPETDYFPETGHTLAGAFRTHWRAHGGLPVFGFPLSEPFVERNPQDGQDYEVQYFERARLEFHPELPPAHQILLGHLGRQYLAQHAAPAWALEPVPNTDAAWAAVRPTRVTIPQLGIDTGVSAEGFSLGEWDVPRYTAAHYWPVAGYPGMAGNVIIAGHVGYKDTIFSHLPEIRIGDEIVVHVGDTPHRYRAREIATLLPRESWVMLPTSSETLTLVTCVPIRVYTHRLVIRAEPVR